jgi:LemA protein
MKKSTVSLLVIAGLLVVIIFGSISIYNKLVKYDEATQSAWGQVQNVYKRRADLIPNLVATVKGYAKHESGTLEAVVAARAKATQITVDASNLTPAKLKEYQEAQGQLSSALGKLMMIKESYPDLKANQNFMDLQAQLEGTENRITEERRKFNEVVQEYNKAVRSFPASIFAGMFGFQKKAYFEAEASAANAPQIQF